MELLHSLLEGSAHILLTVGFTSFPFVAGMFLIK